jgi:hypothetical protein
MNGCRRSWREAVHRRRGLALLAAMNASSPSIGQRSARPNLTDGIGPRGAVRAHTRASGRAWRWVDGVAWEGRGVASFFPSTRLFVFAARDDVTPVGVAGAAMNGFGVR